MADLDPGPLDTALYELGPTPSFSRFCETAEPLFEAFVAGRSFIPWMERSLEELARMPTAKAGVDGKPYHLWATMHGRLALVRVRSKQEGNPKTLTGHVFHRLMKVVSGRLRASRWRHLERVDPTVLDRHARLTLVEDVWLAPGTLIRLEAGQDVIEFSKGQGVVAGLDSAPIHTTRWAYDRTSLAPVAVVVADARIGRIEHALQMLREIGNADDALGLEPLMRNHVHSVRWSAVRTAVQLGHPDGRLLVERALEDPHPHVRNAAAKALALFDANGSHS